jgi:hypothetical protein
VAVHYCVLKKPTTGPYLDPLKPSHFHTFLQHPFQYYPPSHAYISQVVSSFEVFWPNCCIHFHLPHGSHCYTHNILLNITTTTADKENKIIPQFNSLGIYNIISNSRTVLLTQLNFNSKNVLQELLILHQLIMNSSSNHNKLLYMYLEL